MRGGRRVFHALVYSLDSHKSRIAARKFELCQVSLLGGRAASVWVMLHCLLEHISRKLDCLVVDFMKQIQT